MIIAALYEFNVSIIKSFLDKKEFEFDDDLVNLDMNNIDYDINYSKAKEVAWYALIAEIPVIISLIFIVYLYFFDTQ